MWKSHLQPLQSGEHPALPLACTNVPKHGAGTLPVNGQLFYPPKFKHEWILPLFPPSQQITRTSINPVFSYKLMSSHKLRY